jgi:hypothetical protein
VGEGLDCSRRSQETGGPGGGRDEAGDWHEGWQALAANRGHAIEVTLGSNRADIVLRNGLVVELHSGTRSGQDRAITRMREAAYSIGPLGMIWVVRLSEHELQPSGWFRGPVHESLAHFNARTYAARDVDHRPALRRDGGPNPETVSHAVHGVSIDRRVVEDPTDPDGSRRYYGSMRSSSSWGTPEEFLAWAENWTPAHLLAGGTWVHGQWHLGGAA